MPEAPPRHARPSGPDGFALRLVERIRFGDTDRIGHVNNAVISTYLEIGRTAFLWDPVLRSCIPGGYFVLARLGIEFHAEIVHPGEVEIGTSVVQIGRSSVSARQAIFQSGVCAVTADAVIVHVAEATRRASPLPDDARAYLTSLSPPRGAAGS